MSSSGGSPTSIDAILFTDLVGFTEYTETAGDAAAVSVLDEQTGIARAALADSLAGERGRLVKELGDGLMFWFDRPDHAVVVARRILMRVDASRDEHGFPLAMRMGIHCGEVVSRGEDFVGQTVNVAARVADLAGPGELLVSEDVVAAVADSSAGISFRPIGPTRVKGVSAPIWLHRLDC